MQKDMFNGAEKWLFGTAKNLRKEMTPAELLLWSRLRKKPAGFKFRRQHPMGMHILDFYCHKARLVIEVDGVVHSLPEVKVNDEKRQKMIESCGLRVLRFSNEEVLKNVNEVMKTIISHLPS